MLKFYISSILISKSVNKNADYFSVKYLSNLSKNLKSDAQKKQDYIHYNQGQYNEQLDVNEYFYFLDQHGQYFFENLRLNTKERYKTEFPYVSLSGSERNYLRCNDLPFVITYLDEKNDLLHLNQINSAHWSFHFDPKRLCHNPRNERLYYLFENKELIYSERKIKCEHEDPKRMTHLDKLPCRIALVKPQLAIYMMKKTKVILEKDKKLAEEPLYTYLYKNTQYDLKNINLCPNVQEIWTKFSMYGKELLTKNPHEKY